MTRVMSATGPSPRRSDRAYVKNICEEETTKGAGWCRHYPSGLGPKSRPALLPLGHELEAEWLVGHVSFPDMLPPRASPDGFWTSSAGYAGYPDKL
jgi:hypothetical protein